MKRALIDLTTAIIVLTPVIILIAVAYFQIMAITDTLKAMVAKFNQIIVVEGKCPVTVIRHQ